MEDLDPDDDVFVDEALFDKEVATVVHIKAVGTIGVGQTRGDLQQILEALRVGPVTFTEWWAAIQKTEKQRPMEHYVCRVWVP